MVFTAVGNPPYQKNLHLQIIEKMVPFIGEDGGCFIHPARWYEDPLWKLKKNPDRERFSNITDNLEEVKLLSAWEASKIFNILLSTDLMISKIGDQNDISFMDKKAKDCIQIILKYSAEHNLGDFIEKNKIDGIRCPLNLINPIECLGDSTYRKKSCCNLFQLNENSVFCNGYDAKGEEWVKRNGKDSGSTFPHSIKFPTMKEARNFESSCNTNFYNNIIYLLKSDQHTPIKFLPWMQDYSHPWTDKDYCEFFGKLGMSKACQEWMCREVPDYRIKDFILYE